MNNYCAAIDLGTNTARLLIAVRESGVIKPVRVEREVVRLGGGFTDKLGLSPDACERGLACLHRFAGILAEYGVTQVAASATSAVRDAVNGAAFATRVLQETGINLVVIDGFLEASLTLEGVISGLDSKNDKLVVLDVGGGSTEFIVSEIRNTMFVKSMPIGVVRLTEGFCSVAAMTARIDSVLDSLENDLAAAGIVVSGKSDFVGTAGTATTVAAIKLEMVDYDYRKVNNYCVSKGDIAAIFERLSILTPQERLAVKGVEAGREDLIIAGLLIIMSIMERFGFDQLKVSDFGLLEGLALSGSNIGKP